MPTITQHLTVAPGAQSMISRWVQIVSFGVRHSDQFRLTVQSGICRGDLLIAAFPELASRQSAWGIAGSSVSAQPQS